MNSLTTNKYFTPATSDLCIGYECEVKIPTSDWYKHDTWKSFVLQNKGSDWGGGDCSELDEAINKIRLDEVRVPYLTKEQIEKEGWTYTGKAIDIWFEKEGAFEMGSWTTYKIRMHYGADYRLYIHAVDTGNEHYIFEGQCKDINTFRYISKLLGI